MATAATTRAFARIATRASPSTFKTTATRNGARFAPLARQAFRQQSRRGYADSSAPRSGGSTAWIYGLGAAAIGAGGVYWYTQNPDFFSAAKKETGHSHQNMRITRPSTITLLSYWKRRMTTTMEATDRC
jgi:cytochrome c peroxidase